MIVVGHLGINWLVDLARLPGYIAEKSQQQIRSDSFSTNQFFFFGYTCYPDLRKHTKASTLPLFVATRSVTADIGYCNSKMQYTQFFSLNNFSFDSFGLPHLCIMENKDCFKVCAAGAILPRAVVTSKY